MPVPETPVQRVWGNEDSTATFSRTRPKEDKNKRDSETEVSQAPNTDVEDIAVALDKSTLSPEPIAVNSSTIDILTRMFVSYGKHSHGNVRWEHFVSAMADAGAVASQAAGSAVTFREQRTNRAIVLHQPHPDHRINPIMLRSFGKRLSRNFDWDIDLFVERD